MKLKSKITKALALTLMLTSMIPAHASESKIVNVNGADRVLTSIYASRLVKNTDTVVVANAYSFPDALSAYNLVKKYNAKLILVSPNSNITSDLHGIKRAFIVGGQDTLGGRIESDLRNYIPSVKRVEGNDRYATNEATLNETGFTSVGVADGRNFPDALSASGLLAKENLGLMLVDGSKSYTTNRNVRYTFGGYSSVAQSGGIRLAGNDRYQTSIAINKRFNAKVKAIADGSQFADALSAINVLSIADANVMLTSNYMNDDSKAIIKNADKVYVIGGKVSHNALNAVRSVLGLQTLPENKKPADKKVDDKKPEDKKTEDEKKPPVKRYTLADYKRDYPILNKSTFTKDDELKLRAAFAALSKITEPNDLAEAKKIEKKISDALLQINTKPPKTEDNNTVTPPSNQYKLENYKNEFSDVFNMTVNDVTLENGARIKLAISKGKDVIYTYEQMTEMDRLRNILKDLLSKLNKLEYHQSQSELAKRLDYNKIKNEFYKLVNDERIKNGIKPMEVETDPDYIEMQELRTKDLSISFSHHSSGQINPSQDLQNRFEAYKERVKFNMGTENIAIQSLYENEYDIAKSVFDRWMASPGHKRNLMSATLHKQYLGICLNPENNKLYIGHYFIELNQ